MASKLIRFGIAGSALLGAAACAGFSIHAAQERPKLFYQGPGGNGEVSRLLFLASKKEFEDIHVKVEDARKQVTVAYGQLPVLKYNGETFAQSQAINRFLAREFDLYGKNNVEAAKIDEVCEGFVDFRTRFFFPIFTKKGEEREQFIENYKTKSLPTTLQNFENIVKANNSKNYFVGSKLSLADLTAYYALTMLEKTIPGALDKYPILKSIVQNVGDIPEIKAHYAKQATK